MPTKPVQYFEVWCDFPACSERLESSEGFTAWPDHGWADDIAVNADWRRGTGRQYGQMFCPDHRVWIGSELMRMSPDAWPKHPFLFTDDEIEYDSTDVELSSAPRN